MISEEILDNIFNKDQLTIEDIIWCDYLLLGLNLRHLFIKDNKLYV
jgi:hypothetical protein